MTLQFKATEIGCEDDGFALVCGASNSKANEPYHYITIQGCSDPDDEDDDGIHFEIDDQINGGYDLLRACQVSRSQIFVDLHHDVPWHSGLERVVIDCAAASAAEFDSLVAGLRRLFRDRPTDLILELQ